MSEKLEPLKQITNIQTGQKGMEKIFSKKIETEKKDFSKFDTQQMATQIKEEVYSGDSEKQALSDKEVIETYLQDDRTKINAIYWANEFNQRFNGNWFTIEQVRKKTQFKSANEAHGILQVMCMLGLCHLNGETGKYKITLNLEQKLLLLTKEKERAEAEKQKALLEIGMQYDMKIASLEREIERMSKVVEEVSEETEGK